MTDSRKRQPRGIPTGGEFAANMHDEASSELGADFTTSREAVVGDAKVYMAHDGEAWRAHLMVDKDKLPFQHPLRSSADDDGFVEIGSTPTAEDMLEPNINAITLMHAQNLARDLDEVGSSRSESVAQRHLRDLAGVKAYTSDAIRANVNAPAVASQALEWLHSASQVQSRDPETLAALQGVAAAAIQDARAKGGRDTDDIAREGVKNLGARHNDPFRHRALERAAAMAASRVQARRENVISESVEHRLTGSNLADDPDVRALVSSAADYAYTESWKGSRLGSYPDMAREGVMSSPSREAFEKMPVEQQTEVLRLAALTAMDGHSEASAEMFG